MVLPGDGLAVKIRHIGMRDGNVVVRVKIFNQREEKVLEGTAEVAQATQLVLVPFQVGTVPMLIPCGSQVPDQRRKPFASVVSRVKQLIRVTWIRPHAPSSRPTTRSTPP